MPVVLTTAVFAMVLVLGVLGTLGLYILTERETADPRVLNRSEAEGLAKTRGGRREPQDNDTGRSDPGRRAEERDDHRDGRGGPENRWGSESSERE